MLTKEQQEATNLSDSFTLAYGFLGKSLIQMYGDLGEKALRDGTRAFGRDRAEALRRRHLEANYKVNMKSLFTVGYDLPSDPRFKRELQFIVDEARVSHTLYCPMAAIWKDYGMMDIGRIYCEEFHNACYSHYAYNYTKVNLSKTQTQAEDDYCAFNVLLIPENLPEELKPICFEQYDPDYSGPSHPLTSPTAKDGFSSLYIKILHHIFCAAIAVLGEKGILAVQGALQFSAKHALQLFGQQNEQLTQDYFFRNYPLAQNIEDEKMWSDYDSHNLKQLVLKNFYDVVYATIP
ncbi:L-2-amino-thiazoline-4-carboxylic acid hydrolase [Pygmaiobacter massiliensis]|uniref:L-2-amino-thiazoline-4-carboxylic acid hydrolase n=1 Tax=Pygmaiobacter massiliensis TaxID=1917873 RepID=UPI000C7BDE9C|nr:L-2-amino-thiazoline-4-carboxylic acid hydrolase [Pygmaiobacter massiliensis]